MDPDLIIELISLGNDATVDGATLSKSTIESMKSHINLLKKNKVPITEEALTKNIPAMLNKLKYMRKNEFLKDEYKRQILMTIKRIFKKKVIPANEYDQNRSRIRNKRPLTVEEVEALRTIRDKASEIIKYISNQKSIEDLGLYDACIVVLISDCTSLRIDEILQLKMYHMSKIMANEPIGIKSKRSVKLRSVVPNAFLLDIFKAVNLQRNYVKQNIHIKKLDHASKRQRYKFDKGYIIITSKSYVRIKLRELKSLAGVKFNNLGFNKFRAHITGLLVHKGAHRTAQAMNNHKSLNTTIGNYTDPSHAAQAAEDTFENLFGMIDKAAHQKNEE